MRNMKMKPEPRHEPMAYYSSKHQEGTAKIQKPLDILIKMPDASHASLLMKELNTGALDPAVFNHFGAQQAQSLITLKIHNTQNTSFCNGFLIALSDTLKSHMLSKDNTSDEKISFFLAGQEAAAAATCLASCGLWNQSYSFESQAQEQLFLKYHSQIQKAIEQGKAAFLKKIQHPKQTPGKDKGESHA